MTRQTLFALAVLAAAPAGRARAAGFELLEHGAAATGMVGAFTAKADDPSAIFYNPGGLATQRGLHLYAGTTLIASMNSASFGSTKQDADSQFIPLPTIYAAYGLPHDLAVGVGAFTQFGLQVAWPGGWAGRYVSDKASLDSVTINPTVSWRPHRYIGIGAGVDLTPASADLKRSLNLLSTDGSVRFQGDAFGVGGNVGVLVRVPTLGPIRDASLGVNYRSRYDLNFDDGVIRATSTPELAGLLHDTKGSTMLPIPDLLSVGLGARPAERLFVQAEVNWTNWSRFQTLQLKVSDPMSPLGGLTIPQNWSDGYTLRVGAEYALDSVRLRAGVGYDWNPAPSQTLSPIIPDSDRILFSGGASFDIPGGVIAEVALMGVAFRERTSTLPEFPAVYSSFALLTGLSLSYAGH
jgi:long-chain fatty acid transport protein